MITIKKANISDAKYFSELILVSAPYFPLLFGQKVKTILEYMFFSPGNLFSYKHVYFGTIDTKKAGMILSYSYQTKKKENLRTGLLLLRYVGVNILTKLPILMKFNATVGRLDKEEYYISNIATFPKFRGMGVGKKLMLVAEDDAKRNNTKRIILDVEKENITAITFYKKLGYQTAKEFSIPLGKEVLHFYRMIKKLG